MPTRVVLAADHSLVRWAIDFGSEACRWNLGRAANPIRHETHILKAFDIAGSQAGGLSSFAQEFCRPRRSCNGEDSITGPARHGELPGGGSAWPIQRNERRG